MKILIVSATEKEIFSLKERLTENQSTSCGVSSSVLDEICVDFLVTGIGVVFTTYHLLRKLSEKEYDLVINAGIAGSFNENLSIGDVVYVKNEQFADLGIENQNGLTTLFEKGYISENQFPFKNAKLENYYDSNFNLKGVSAITVNTTHGKKDSIQMFKNKFKADIETMEGAAFFYVCLQEGIKFFQIRSISNYVEERDIAKWNIPLAIKNLNDKLLEIINNFEIENSNYNTF